MIFADSVFGKSQLKRQPTQFTTPLKLVTGSSMVPLVCCPSLFSPFLSNLDGDTKITEMRKRPARESNALSMKGSSSVPIYSSLPSCGILSMKKIVLSPSQENSLNGGDSTTLTSSTSTSLLLSNTLTPPTLTLPAGPTSKEKPSNPKLPSRKHTKLSSPSSIKA
jgi:hypothetical protein